MSAKYLICSYGYLKNSKGYIAVILHDIFTRVSAGVGQSNSSSVLLRLSKLTKQYLLFQYTRQSILFSSAGKSKNL